MVRTYKKLYMLSLILIMAVSMTVAARNIVKAQADVVAPTQVEFVGTVEAVDATTVTVNGHVIALAGAEIQGTLTVGAIVKVEATIDVGGNFTATEVKSVEATDRGPQELELHGTVSAINGTVYTVAGLTFDALNAKLEGNPQIGDSVEVKLILSNGVLVASKIEAHVEDEGILDGNDTLGNDTLENDLFGNDTLGNENNDDFGNDDNDDLLGNENNDDFGNDDNDDVLGNENNDDFGNDDLGEDAKLIGTLEQVGEGFIVVQGQQIDITNAHLETTLIVGATVTVEVINVNGVLVASEVKNETDDHSGGNGGPSANSGSGGGGDDCGSHDGWSEYHVRSGDTLSEIASRSGTSVNDIVAANCIENPNRVRIGTPIVVPNGSVLDNEPDDDHGGSDDLLGNDANDDGPGHDLNDDHGGDNLDDVNDDHGGDNLDDVNDDHGGTSGSDGSDDLNDDHGGDSGNSGSGGGSDDGDDHDSGDDHGGSSGNSGSGGHHGGDDHDDDD